MDVASPHVQNILGFLPMEAWETHLAKGEGWFFYKTRIQKAFLPKLETAG